MSIPVPTETPSLVDPDDEALAIKTGVPILISGDSPAAVEDVARRIHKGKFGTDEGFVRADAAAFPDDPLLLAQHFATLLNMTTNATLFIADVEALPLGVQPALLQWLAESSGAAPRGCAVRLVTGTTTSLWRHVQQGTISEALFYRLNTIHLILSAV